MRKRMRKLGITVVLVLLVGTGCSKYNDERGKGDAPVLGRHGDSTPAEVYNFPNGFGNVATKCVGHGFRAYVVTHAKTDVPPTIVSDPSCGGASR